MKIVWRHVAALQFESQLAYLKAENKFAAKRMRQRIKQRFARLKHSPRTGRISRQPDVRELVISGTPYVAVYQVLADTITVLQFFHSSEDR